MDTFALAKMLSDDPERALPSLKEFLKSGKTPKLRFTATPHLLQLSKELAICLRKNERRFDILRKIWEIGERDEKLIVIFVLEKFSKSMPGEVYNFVSGVLKDIDNWEVCDQMALKVTVFLLIKLEEKMWDTLSAWKRSEYPWIRRPAVATIPPYVRRRPEDSIRCLEFLDDLMTDRSREVRKALSWALREISKKNPEAAFRFLMKWRHRARHIVKEGMKKLPADLQAEILQNGI